MTSVLPVPLLVLVVACAMMVIERWRPARVRGASGAWWCRAALFNGAQAAVAYLGAISWDEWLPVAPWARDVAWAPLPGVLAGYLLVTFVYYWWHRLRHAQPLLWRYVHRLHHSPTRIEILTSFYKHPLELVLNGVLSSALLVTVLGLPPLLVAATVMVTGLAELFYHWNVRTPRWLGWFFQRPEMHRVHHERGRHTSNFSDLPLWDAMFGTLRNPRSDVCDCGFPEEARIGRLLLGRDVDETGIGR